MSPFFNCIIMAKKNTSISIEEEVLTQAEEQCKKEKRSFSSMVELLVEKYLNYINNKK